jgi:ankyrin repeat protein
LDVINPNPGRAGILISLLVVFSVAGCAHFHTSSDPGRDLRMAAYAGDLKQVEAILGKHPDLINAQADLSRVETNRNRFPKRLATTPPYFVEVEAARLGPLQMAGFLEHDDVVVFLLRRGADVNLRDKAGATALHGAANFGYTNQIILLIGAGADVKARANNGRTPLHWAATGDKMAAVILLLAHGAEVNARSASGETPVDEALRNGHTQLAAFLRERGGIE